MTTSYPVDLRALSALIEVIYKCALDPAGWRIALRQICEAIDTDTAALYLVDFHQREPRLYAQWGMPEEKAAEWQTRFGADVAALHREIAVRSASYPDDPTLYSRLFTPAERAALRVDREWAQPLGICDVVGLSLSTTATRTGMLAATRHARVGVATELELTVMRFLAPHIRQAVRIGDLLDMRRVETSSLRSTLDTIGAGVAIVGAGGRILHANAAVKQMFWDGHPVRAIEGRLVGARPEAAHALAEAIARVQIDPGMPPVLRSSTVGLSQSDGAVMLAHILPLDCRSPQSQLLPQALAAVIMSQADISSTAVLDGLSATYGLTDAERRLLQQIAQGGSVGEAGLAIGVSANTAKSHLQQIFRKTGVTRTAELVALIGRLAPAIGPFAKGQLSSK
jgi:DNA-binding CsgD family transcriptional regulator/PAS domain-containing protein